MMPGMNPQVCWWCWLVHRCPKFPFYLVDEQRGAWHQPKMATGFMMRAGIPVTGPSIFTKRTLVSRGFKPAAKEVVSCAIQRLGGSNRRSVWGIYIPFAYCIEFPNHLIVCYCLLHYVSCLSHQLMLLESNALLFVAGNHGYYHP